MRVTHVTVRIVRNPRHDLLAYVTVTFDDELMVSDITLIAGRQGPFLAFPSTTGKRYCTDPRCGKNCRQIHRYCPWCGRQLPFFSPPFDRFDVTHPTNGDFRRTVTDEVLKVFAAQGGVVPEVPPSVARLEHPVAAAVEDRHDAAG